VLEDALTLIPGSSITVQDDKDGVKWYEIGETVRKPDAWIVSLKALDWQTGKAPSRELTLRPDGVLS